VARPRIARTALITVAAVVVVVLVAAIGAVVVALRSPLPRTSGTLDLAGLTAEVTVTRDARGVPTITAENPHDLFLAQGFTDAQDRFFVMDFRRHVTAGRLAELVGDDESAIEADKVIRTLGWRRVAEQEWDLLDGDTREALQAYADGVNAYLEGRSPGDISAEYTVLGLRVDVQAPEQWSPIDSLAWLKAMAWDLRANYDDELERAMDYAQLGDVERVDELFPVYPEDLNAPILPASDDDEATALDEATATATSAPAEALRLRAADVQAAIVSADAALAAVPQLVGTSEAVGSNSWVVSGDLTASGAPLLANDPHLSISAPGIWSQVQLRCAQVDAACPYDVAGFSFAGMPGVIIGHNADLAWGLTNLGADVSDFYVERIVGGAQVVDGERIPLETRTETIEVAGGDPIELTVRTTTHGPIVSDVLDVDDAVRPVAGLVSGNGYAVSLAWTALTPGATANAILMLDTAADAADVAAAAAAFEVPSQNIVFATTDGHIGYQAPGRIPVRGAVADSDLPIDGTWPRPGWDSAYDWQGFVPASRMPHALDPADGFVVAANQQVTPLGTEPYLASDWDYGYRAQRIRDLLTEQVDAGTKITVETMAQIQDDELWPAAEILVPRLLGIGLDPGFDSDGQALLRDWDRKASTDSAAAAYFAAVWADVLELTFADDLPDGHAPDGGSRWVEVMRQILDEPDSPWWDDRSTPGIQEGRDDVLARALVSARVELTAQISSNPADWRWGLLHVAAPQHPVLGGDGVPSLVSGQFNPDPVAVGGASSVVDATAWDASSGSYTVSAAPSMRMVVDLGDLDGSTWVNLTGTSGHIWSPHYDDQLATWASGGTYPWPFTAAAVTADAASTLTLRPES
jgi:penicillin amidase